MQTKSSCNGRPITNLEITKITIWSQLKTVRCLVLTRTSTILKGTDDTKVIVVLNTVTKEITEY